MKEEWIKKCLDKDYTSKIDFNPRKDVKDYLKNKKKTFLPNPKKNWGPKAMAT